MLPRLSQQTLFPIKVKRRTKHRANKTRFPTSCTLPSEQLFRDSHIRIAPRLLSNSRLKISSSELNILHSGDSSKIKNTELYKNMDASRSVFCCGSNCCFLPVGVKKSACAYSSSRVFFTFQRKWRNANVKHFSVTMFHAIGSPKIQIVYNRKKVLLPHRLSTIKQDALHSTT